MPPSPAPPVHRPKSTHRSADAAADANADVSHVTASDPLPSLSRSDARSTAGHEMVHVPQIKSPRRKKPK